MKYMKVRSSEMIFMILFFVNLNYLLFLIKMKRRFRSEMIIYEIREGAFKKLLFDCLTSSMMIDDLTISYEFIIHLHYERRFLKYE